MAVTRNREPEQFVSPMGCIDAPSKGAHVLRHTLATRLLREGSSLPEIGEVLRHRQQQTTTIYAKVDFASLRAIAPSWPGGAQ